MSNSTGRHFLGKADKATSQLAKDPLESLIEDSEILDDPGLPDPEIHEFQVPAAADGAASSAVDGGATDALVGAGAIEGTQMVELVPPPVDGLSLSIENVEVLHAPTVEFGQILRSALSR